MVLSVCIFNVRKFHIAGIPMDSAFHNVNIKRGTYAIN